MHTAMFFVVFYDVDSCPLAELLREAQGAVADHTLRAGSLKMDMVKAKGATQERWPPI